MMRGCHVLPEDSEGRILVLDTAGAERVKRCALRIGRGRSIVVSPVIRAEFFIQSGIDVVATGERTLDLRAVELERLLREHAPRRIVIPLGIPREALIHVLRFVDANKEHHFEVDIGRESTLKVTSRVVKTLLFLNSWFIWAPLFVVIRVLEGIDGPMLIVLQKMARRSKRNRRSNADGPVCHVIPTLGTGGAQRQLINIIRGSILRNQSVVVLVLWKEQSVLEKEIESLQPYFVTIDVNPAAAEGGPFSRGLRMTVATWRLFCWFRKNRPRAVVSWLFFSNIVVPPAARMAGVPGVLSMVRNLSVWKTWDGFRKWWMPRADREASRLCDLVVANSHAVLEDFVDWTGIERDQIITIPNGIDIAEIRSRPFNDVRKELGISEGTSVVLCLARLVRGKGQDVLIHSLAEIEKTHADVVALLVGHGEFEGELRSIVKELHLSTRVIFAGRTTVPHDYYRAADVFVLPSLLEGMPNVILEAQAFGLPVVATAVGGTPEIIVDGETGILVPPGSVEALAEAVIRVLDDPEFAASIGMRGALRVKTLFDIGMTIEQLETNIDSLVQPQSPIRDFQSRNPRDSNGMG